MSINKRQVVIPYGGPSKEHEVSINSCKAILKNINYDKYEIFVMYISKDKKALIYKIDSQENNPSLPSDEDMNPLLTEIQKLEKDQLVFLGAMHGEFGEDGTIQSILDTLGINYTGSNAYASRLAMDKYRSSIVAHSIEEINIPHMEVLKFKDLQKYNKTQPPFVIKPNRMGSSVGTAKIQSMENLNDYINKSKKENTFSSDDELLIQEFISGTEITCGYLERVFEGNHEEVLLTPTEIVANKGEFYDYTSKYASGGSTHIIPPQSIDQDMQNKISRLAKDIHKKLGCGTYSRSDFIISIGSIFYLETNTLPGFTDTSLLPEQAEYSGIPYRKLLDYLIEPKL